MKFELKYQPEKGGDWPFRCQPTCLPAIRQDYQEWCTDTFEPGSWYGTGGASYWFKNREDALMFIMRCG